MSAPIRTDALSLTLPKALGRARSKRREKPPWLFWVYLATCLFYVGYTAWMALTGHPALYVVGVVAACLYWRLTVFTWAGRSTLHLLPYQFALVPTFIVAGFLP